MISDHVGGRLSRLDAQIVAAVPEGGNWRDLPETIDSARVRQIRESAAQGKGSRSTYYGRLRWGRPSYTVSTYFNRPGNGCFIHPSADRLITIREAARLQSFPDSYRFCGKGRAPYSQVGNAVPPVLAYQLGRVLRPGPMVDLFAGAGGLSLGLEWAGFEHIAAVDNDEAALRTFQENRSGDAQVHVTDLSDVAEVGRCVAGIGRRAARSGIELVAGGPPCQGFSTAGDCRLDDPRNKLVFAFVEAVAALRPRQVLMENVASLVFRGRRGILDDVQRSLCRQGFTTSVVIAHAEGYGVPQLRRRLFLLGVRDGLPKWPAPSRRILNPMMAKYQPQAEEPCLAEPISVQEAIGDLPTEAANSPDEAVSYASDAQSDYQRWVRGLIQVAQFCGSPLVAEDRRQPFLISAS